MSLSTSRVYKDTTVRYYKSVKNILPAAALIGSLLAVHASVSAATAPCPFVWNTMLRVGAQSTDVLALQQFLNQHSATTIATTGAGSPGNESTYFGAKTAAAVSKFQQQYASDILTPNGLTTGTGIVGAATRAKLNALCTAPTTSATSATSTTFASATTIGDTDQLTVSDPGQAPSSIAPAGAGVNFTSITLTAGSKDVVLKSMTIERVGMGADAAFAAIALTDPSGLQIGNQYALHADHQVTVTGSYAIPAHTSATFIVVGYMAADLSDFEGQVPALQVDSISASSPVVGPLPLHGPFEILNNSLVIGSADATLSPLDPGSASTHYIGDTNITFSAIRLTAASQEDVSISYMIWEQNGTAGAKDFTNVRTIIGNTEVPAVLQPDGKTYISLFNPAIVIQKGTSVDLSVKGNLTTSGAGRTAEFDIHDNTDDEGTAGLMYGFGVGVFATGNTAESGAHSAFITSDGTTEGDAGVPFFAGSIVNISGGAATFIQNY